MSKRGSGSFAGTHHKPRAATWSTNSVGGKALVVLPEGYVRCPVCRNKCRSHPDNAIALRPHRDLHGHPCYCREQVSA